MAVTGETTMAARPGRDLPQSRRAFFLNLRMRRKILKRQHVASRKAYHRVRIRSSSQFAKRAQHRQQIFGGAIVSYNQHERTLNRAPQQNNDQRLGRRGQSGDTNPPRAFPQMGGGTREGR